MVAVLVMVTVLIVGVTDAVNEMVEVLEGRGLLVVVAVRLGVVDGSGLACIVAVDVATGIAAGDGRPVPMKMMRIPAKSRSEIPLKRIP
jgi:hypothetical protein